MKLAERKKEKLAKSRKDISSRGDKPGKDTGPGKCLVYLKNFNKSSLTKGQEEWHEMKLLEVWSQIMWCFGAISNGFKKWIEGVFLCFIKIIVCWKGKSKTRSHQTNYETMMMNKLMAWVMLNAVEMERIELKYIMKLKLTYSFHIAKFRG